MRCIRVLLLVGLLALLSANCVSSEAVLDSPDVSESKPIEPVFGLTERTFQLGTAGLVPKRWPDPLDSDWQDLFNEISEYGELYGVHVSPELGQDIDRDGLPGTVTVSFAIAEDAPNTATYAGIGIALEDMEPAEAEVHLTRDGGINRDALRDLVVATAEEYQPEILLVGVEINRLWELSPTGFDDYVALYNELRTEIRAVSPETRVGPNFQWDYMRGEAQHTGVDHTAHLELIDRFEGQMDLVSLTVYPFFTFDRPADIPDDYLAVIAGHTDVPVLITETGWPTSESPIPTVDASDRAQAEYLERLVELGASIDLEGIVWVFPHDAAFGLANTTLFDRLSLVANDGTTKPLWETWQALRALPLVDGQ